MDYHLFLNKVSLELKLAILIIISKFIQCKEEVLKMLKKKFTVIKRPYN